MVSKRRLHPLAIAGLWAAKKVVFLGVANRYGWPLIYRRMAEQSRYLMKDRGTRIYVNARMREAIRAPTHAYDVLTDSKVASLMAKIIEAGAHTTGAAARTTDSAARTSLPPFLYNLIASAVETFGTVGSTAYSAASKLPKSMGVDGGLGSAVATKAAEAAAGLGKTAGAVAGAAGSAAGSAAGRAPGRAAAETAAGAKAGL